VIIGGQSLFDIVDNGLPFICHFLLIEANLRDITMQFTATDHFRHPSDEWIRFITRN
jgi:hypothetical protein